ncbi:MAG: hypothetical protein J6X69_07075 [Bacteroidales bacterium]|nr:hypothetical protein [Bacteroidales bacterium]
MCLGLTGLFSLYLGAQPPSIPDLQADKAIVRGELDNGVRYALWPDASFKDCFIISLIQKDSICFQEKFNATRKGPAVDSVFYRAFAATRDAIAAQPKQFGCDNTMIFVTGDFKKEDILARMQHLSVVLPRHQSQWKRKERPAWEDIPPTLQVQETGDGHVILTYKLYSPATDENLNATIIPTIVERSWTLFGRILERRVECALEAGGIPYGGVSARFKMAQGLENHHLFSLQTVVAQADEARTAERIYRVLEDLRTGLVSEGEVEAASNSYLFGRFDRQLRPVTPSVQALRLFRSYLYNNDLASDREKTEFFTSKKYFPNEDKKRFDRFTARSVRIPAFCTTTDGEIRVSLDNLPPTKGPVLHFADTMSFPGKTKACKVARTITEGTTGGSMFFFENGTRVVYKQKSCGKRVYYTFVFEGGMAQLTNTDGAAWMEDIFYAGRVNGYRMKDFMSLLAAGGIDLYFTASHAALTLAGSCEENKVSSLLKALIALTGHWRVEEKDWDFITRCAQIPSYKDPVQRARLQVSRQLHPGYAWDLDKNNVTPSMEALREVAGLIRGCFRSTRNATLFMQGNIPERRIVSKLRQFMDQFPVDGRHDKRNPATMLTVSGTTRMGDIAPEKPVLIVSSFNYPTGLDQQLVKEIAIALAQDRLRMNLAGVGVRCRIRENIIYQPVENVELFIRLSGSGMDAMHIVNETLREMGNGKIPKASFEGAIAELLSRTRAQENSPFYWRDILFNRVVYGKDYHNRVKDRLEKLSQEEVSRFCAQWAEAGRVEYVME